MYRRALLTLAVALAALAAPALAGAAAEVTLVAEPLSSAPPLYAGEPLVPLGGSVRVVAVADLSSGAGKALDPLTLDYQWTVDGVTALGGSGVGRRVLIVDSPLEYRSRTVAVTVASPDGAVVGSATTDLVASEPTMRIYEKQPLAGLRLDQALEGSYALTGSEATLYAAPYSFPTSLSAPALSWYLAGSLAQTGNLITLRPTGAGAGSASVSATGASSDIANASTALTVSFGSGSGSNIFGL